MTISRIQADKVNLDLRAIILDALHGLCSQKKKGRGENKADQVFFEKAQSNLQYLRSQFSMLSSFSHYYKIDIDFDDLVSLVRKAVKEQDFETERQLAQILSTLEEKFDERVQTSRFAEKL
jgi:hypothetical protein